MNQILTSIPSSMPPTALTIGSFDGVHLGHQALIAALKSKAAHTTLLTFINHPHQVLNPQTNHFGLLTTFPQKLALLKDYGIDTVIAMAFTRELASIPFDIFLSQFNLTHLLLGKGSSFGKAREGIEEKVTLFAKNQGFIAEYLPKLLHDGKPVSSKRIRAAIAQGDFALASDLLGHPFSLSFPKDKLQVNETTLCLPPEGRYFVKADKVPVILEIKGTILMVPHPFSKHTLLTFEPASKLEVIHV